MTDVAPRIVALDAARGELWVTLRWPDGTTFDRPIADVETAQLVDVVRRGELPRVVADSVAARMPRTLGGALSAVEELFNDGPLGLYAPIADQEHPDLIDELKAAGRRKIAEWVQELGRLAVRAQEQRDEWLRLHNDPAPMPADVRVELAVRGGEADSRAHRLLMVRDWLYEVAPLVDYDTADVTDRRGFPQPVGALQALAVPAAIVTILAGFTLAGWIVREGRLERQHAAELEVFRETRDHLATCSTERECAAFREALHASGKVFDKDTDDDGLGWGWYAAGAAVVIGLAWSRRAQLGEAAGAVARRVRRG